MDSTDGLPAVSFPALDVKQVMSGAVLFLSFSVIRGRGYDVVGWKTAFRLPPL